MRTSPQILKSPPTLVGMPFGSILLPRRCSQSHLAFKRSCRLAGARRVLGRQAGARRAQPCDFVQVPQVEVNHRSPLDLRRPPVASVWTGYLTSGAPTIPYS
jgi:hypothetical protein